MANRTRASVASSSSKRGKGDKREIAKDEESNEQAVPQLAWKILSESVVEKLMSLAPREAAKELSVALNFQDYEIDLKEASQMDLYVTAIWFACENKFSAEQCSAFFTVLHTLIHNIKDKHLSIDENIQEMKCMMHGVGVSKQTSLQCFTVEVANKVLQYIAESLFQHYRLYEFLFTEEQEGQDNLCEEVHVDLPPLLESLSPAPLEEAVTEEFYTNYISPPPSPAVNVADEDGLKDESQESVEKPLQTLLLTNVSRDEIRTMMHKIAHDTVSTYKAHVEKTLQTRETGYVTKLDKIAKAVKQQ